MKLRFPQPAEDKYQVPSTSRTTSGAKNSRHTKIIKK